MELVTSVALFATFALIVMVAINPLKQYQKAMDARRKNDLAQLSRAIELYYDDHGQYPRNANNGEIINDNTGQAIPWGNERQPYIDLLPKDPADGKKYSYKASSDRQSFWVFASLDIKTDPSKCNSGLQPCNQADTYCSTSGSNPSNEYYCDYGLSSPNTTP